MSKTPYTIRTMTRNEIDMAIEWAAKEGWNPGLQDAACYAAADPNGFFVGLLHDEPIATISAIRYGATFGFIGFYIVKPEFRGKGYGIQIWQAGLQYLEGRNIGLDGVVAQQDNYKKSGFHLAYRNIRYEGVGGGAVPEQVTFVDLKTLPFECVKEYDRYFFPEDRSHFIRMWINQMNGHALGIQHKGGLTGYGVIRPCRLGYKIGPLFADSPEDAGLLFRALKAKVNISDAVFLDVPEVNQAAVKLASQYEMKVAFETARMYTGDPPDMPQQRIFGVTSFEIG